QQARATLGLRNGVVDVYGASFQAAGGSATLLGRFGDGGKLYVTAHGIDLAALSSLGLPLQRGRFYALARIGGSPQAPTAHLRALLAQGTYDDLPLDANAEVGYAGDRVDIEDASALLAGAYATANGEVRGVRMGHLAPRVALAAHARALDVASLAKAMKAHLPYPADGSVDADIRVDGPARAPEVAGTIGVPEGSVNGLFFHDGAAHIRGSLGAMTVREGRVTVGSTRIAFGGHVDPAAQSITLNAPHVDLADFDDFFDPGDMLAGRGSVALDASHAGPALRVSGGAFVAGTRFRRFELGDLRFRARPAPGAQEAELDVNGAHGSLQSTARIALSGADDVSGSARLSNLDLGTWLPAAGITLPVFGDVDAVAQMRGTLHAPVLALQASLANGRVGHVTVNTLTLDGSVDRQHVHLTQAVLELPSLSATVSGTTGLTPAAPFALALRASSPNIGALATTLAGKTVDTAGALAATAQVSGTQSRPHVTAQATLQNLRVRNLVVPRIVASAGLSPTMLTVDRGEIDLTKGVAQLTAHVPVNLAAHRLAGSDAPVRASLSASQIDLAQFAPAFAEDTKLGGQMDGSLSVGGNLGNPSLGGHLALTNGSYSSSLLTSALTRMTLALDLSGTTMRLSQLHLEAGGGSLDGNGVASVTDLRHSLQTLSLQASAVAKHLRLDAPKYFQGTIDGTVAVTKTPQTTPLVAGSLAFSATRIPLTALLPPSARASSAPSPLPVAFHLAVTAGNDVRVQSANVDIGARGNVLLAGTLASPVLSGRFVSTGGSISFYRTFTLQHGVVAFSPDSGIIPYVDATATTSISDPPTNILLHASGPATHLNVDFASDPSYSRDQIVGLLANLQSVGAVSGVSTVASTGQPSLLTSAAEGYVNDQFTRMLLEPLQSNLGQSLGLQNLQLQAGLGGGYGANATAALGKNLTASFGETYGPTQRQTIGLTQRFSSASSLELALFSATGAAELPVATGYVDDPTQPTDLALLTLIPPAGTKGFTLSYQHHF
ncbi:MAG TPA: translocation/assembly module TamB domain-containing protein, partial [Candidatus Acidoferrales bacterium]|nr:translocation/assembly module TamB domain-containing protein [Candidatus Acidoferrales bacterium]